MSASCNTSVAAAACGRSKGGADIVDGPVDNNVCEKNQIERTTTLQRHVELAEQVARRVATLKACATRSASELLSAAQAEAGVTIDPGPVVMRQHHRVYLEGGRDWDTAVEILAYALWLRRPGTEAGRVGW